MVATVFLDWLLSFGTGLLFGRFGMATFREGRSRLASRAFRDGLLFELVLVVGIALGCYAISADWMWMYWVDPSRLAVGIQIAAFAMYLVAFVAGFLLAPELERLRRGAALWVVGGGVVLLTAVEALTWNRLLHLGTFAAGTAPRLGTALAVLLGVGLPVTLVALVVALRRLSRAGQPGPVPGHPAPADAAARA